MKRLGKVLATPKRQLIVGVAAATIIIASIASVWSMANNAKPTSLLPVSISSQIHGFTPYFFYKTIPNGYSYDASSTIYDQGVLIAALKGRDGSAVTLTEQAMSSSLTDEKLFGDIEAVGGTDGKATVNDVDGRIVGTMVSSDHKTLVLLTAGQATNKNDVISLLRGLSPVK